MCWWAELSPPVLHWCNSFSALTSFNVAYKREDRREGGQELLSFLMYVSLYHLNKLMLTNPNCPVVTKRRACEEHHGLSRAEMSFLWLLGAAMIWMISCFWLRHLILNWVIYREHKNYSSTLTTKTESKLALLFKLISSSQG